ncbi:hypothetical protein MNBD_ALPHA04-1918 [hydrothermal vent metagenome]|uniref:histidine kinase n=1 Tax=hydrothermal vent metagenome TaxID=652676 RepID=A0A3B0S7C3_9ZZZZ
MTTLNRIDNLRFDDRLATVLKGPMPEGLAAALQWRQVVDILAQKPGKLVSNDVQTGLTRLRDLHDRVGEPDRLAGVKSLHGRLRSAPLLVYLCADSGLISETAIKAADIRDHEWADLMPQLPFEAQQFVKDHHSPDVLEPSTETADPDIEVKEMPASDVSIADISDKMSKSTDSVPENSQISALVAKIADYQKNRKNTETPELPLEEIREHRSYFAESTHSINFETDDSGTIIWVEGPPRGALVGVGIARPAFDDGPGPDAYGAAAFRQRMPLENARMRLCGASIVEGNWRMTAIPYFGEDTGRFMGYRGVMRRPNAAEDAGHNSIDVERREQLQQLIHELRTPLNAIIGFSEIIEQQLFGPASFEYRTLSRSIMDEARRLLAGFEDLDVAAKVDSGQMDGVPGSTDPDWLFNQLSQRLRSLTQTKSVDLNIRKAEPVRPFALDGDTVERIFARLLSASIIACDNDEELVAELRTRIGLQPVNSFTLSRPSRIRGISEEQLFDPSQGIEGDSKDAPLLGLGFSLRLVRNLAQAASGSLTISDEKIALTLPAVATSEFSIRETENE